MHRISVSAHDRVFQDETLAELLTTGKLSELACLALYLMYEKMLGKDSYWYPYIHELDKQRGRGQEAVQSPLLWSDEDVESLLKGSPVLVSVQYTIPASFRECVSREQAR